MCTLTCEPGPLQSTGPKLTTLCPASSPREEVDCGALLPLPPRPLWSPLPGAHLYCKTWGCIIISSTCPSSSDVTGRCTTQYTSVSSRELSTWSPPLPLLKFSSSEMCPSSLEPPPWSPPLLKTKTSSSPCPRLPWSPQSPKTWSLLPLLKLHLLLQQTPVLDVFYLARCSELYATSSDQV